MKTVMPIYFYPARDGACLAGEAVRAPAGMPVREVSRAVHGRGKNKTERLLIESAAPQGWGEWSSRAFFAYVCPDQVQP